MIPALTINTDFHFFPLHSGNIKCRKLNEEEVEDPYLRKDESHKAMGIWMQAGVYRNQPAYFQVLGKCPASRHQMNSCMFPWDLLGGEEWRTGWAASLTLYRTQKKHPPKYNCQELSSSRRNLPWADKSNWWLRMWSGSFIAKTRNFHFLAPSFYRLYKIYFTFHHLLSTFSEKLGG